MQFGLESGKICKNNDHTCFFYCINTCMDSWEVFEYSAWQSRVQTASPGPGKMLMHEKTLCDTYSGLSTLMHDVIDLCG